MSDGTIEKLAATYNRSIRTVSGLLPCTPAPTACVETGVLPFKHVFIIAVCSRALNFLEKTEGSDQGVFLLVEANKLLHTLTHQELPKVSTIHHVGDEGWGATPPRIVWALKDIRKKDPGTISAAQRFKEILSINLRGYQVIYTDGSKTTGKVGIGVCGPQINFHKRIPDMASIFSAEAAAILSAITKSVSPLKAIVTDSASVLKALEAPRIRHPWVQEIRNAAGKNTIFVWVPSHSGIPGNERADRLAAIGRDSLFLTDEVPAPDIKNWVSNIVREAWLGEWYQEKRAFLRKIKGEIGKWVDVKGWRDQRVLSRLRTGYTRLTHNFTNTGNFHIDCDTCSVQLTVEHALTSCPLYHQSRLLFGLEGSVRDLLCNEPTREATLLEFVKSSALYDKI